MKPDRSTEDTAVKAAAAGETRCSFEKLEKLGAVVECGLGEQSTRLCDSYLDIAALGESAVVVSQTRAEGREINDAIRERLRERGLLTGDETEVTALEQVDLTSAQKLDARHYPADCVLVFNRDLSGCVRGERGKLIGITAKRLALELNGKVRHVPLSHLDHINVCRERALALSPGDRLQLKANSASAEGRKLANGEVVSVAQIKMQIVFSKTLWPIFFFFTLDSGTLLFDCFAQMLAGGFASSTDLMLLGRCSDSSLTINPIATAFRPGHKLNHHSVTILLSDT